MYLGIAGVDDPYPKHVQDALDFIEKETHKQWFIDERKWHKEYYREELKRGVVPGQASRNADRKFWATRQKQQAAQQKKRPYQQVDRADQWPSW